MIVTCNSCEISAVVSVGSSAAETCVIPPPFGLDKGGL
jgi:hypothetical protein